MPYSALMVVFSVLFVEIFGASQGWSELEISTYFIISLGLSVSYPYLEPAMRYLACALDCLVGGVASWLQLFSNPKAAWENFD